MEKKRGEKTDSDNKILIKQNYVKKINIILKNHIIIEKEVYNLIRNFFKEYLKLDYEFTNEEIKNELKHMYFSEELKDRITNLFNHLSKIEYFSEPISQNSLKNILLEFKSIIDDIIIVHYQEKSSFFNKIHHSIESFIIHNTKINKNILVKNKNLIQNNNQDNNQINQDNNQNDKELQKDKNNNSNLDIDSDISSYTVPEQELSNNKTNKTNKTSKNSEQKKEIQKKESKTLFPLINKLGKTEQKNILQKNILDDYENQIIKKLSEFDKNLKKYPDNAKILYFDVLKLYNLLDEKKKDIYFEKIQKSYVQLKKKLN